MANALYSKAKESFLSGALNLTSLNLKDVAVDAADYTVNLATHQYLSDIAAGGRVATSGNLASKTVTLGVFDAADIEFAGFTGDQFEALVIYNDTTVAATSNLIAYIDTATGLPFTPSGGPVIIRWDDGVSKIFAI